MIDGHHLNATRADVLAFTAFPKQIWRQTWSNSSPRNASTKRADAAPRPSASFPTAPPWSDLSAPSRPNNKTKWIESRRYIWQMAIAKRTFPEKYSLFALRPKRFAHAVITLLACAAISAKLLLL